MKHILSREESSVRLLTVELSEDEMGVLTACLNHALQHFDDEMLDHVCGAYRDEVEGIHDDLYQALNIPFLVQNEPQKQRLAAAD